MFAGPLALWLFANSMGAVDAPVAIRDRSIAIPYNLAANQTDVGEVVLYVSIDQGRAWSRAAVIKPTERAFSYQAPSDGTYWFTVAVVYRNGAQVPADVAQMPPQQKVIVDTVKPVVRFVAADRVNDEVVVAWEIQEQNPDLTTLKLEYRTADAAAGFAIAVPVNPGLAGTARFRPNSAGPLAIRLSMQDTAGNVGVVERTIAGGPNNVAGVAPVQEPIRQTTAYNAGQAPTALPVDPALVPPAPEQFRTAPAAPALATSGRRESVTPNVAAPPANRADLPKIYYTNEPSMTVDYEVEQGPSGISKVEVYLTQDEGRAWMKWQDLTRPPDAGPPGITPATTLPVTVRLPEKEGLYGFRIVPYSGSQLSAGAPQPGDAPELRIQFDKTPPFVELTRVEPDPHDVKTLVLHYRATDAYLADLPIHIYWSENANGDWRSVVTPGPDTGLVNNGRFAWTLPPNMPLKVYMKITAEDKAGNVNEAVTAQPIVVDMHKPVGHVKGITLKPRG